jgi:hypothetical protein
MRKTPSPRHMRKNQDKNPKKIPPCHRNQSVTDAMIKEKFPKKKKKKKN